MKKLFLLSIMLLSVLFVNAQKKNNNEELKAQKRANRLTQQLKLTPEQEPMVQELYLYQAQNKKVKGNDYKNLSQEEKAAFKAERKQAKADFDNRMASILTPAQQDIYKNMKKKKKKKGQVDVLKNKKDLKKSPQEKAQKRVDKMTQQLELDSRQQRRILELLMSQTPKTKGKDKKELTKEERKEIKENRKQEKAKFETSLTDILTADQLETYYQLEKEKKEKKEKKAMKEKKKKKNKQKNR